MHAPLKDLTVQGRSYHWYDVDNLEWIGAIDMLIVDYIVNGAAIVTRGMGEGLRYGQNGRGQYYALVIFGWVAGFSSAAPAQEAVASALNDPAGTNKKLKLLWIGIGKDDFLLKRNEEFTALLKEKGIHYEWRLSEGGHSWPVWRGYLGDLLPVLFKS